MTRALVIAITMAAVGCGRPSSKSRRQSGNRPVARVVKNTVRPPPAKTPPPAVAAAPPKHNTTRRKACRAMYAKRLRTLAPLLARFGVTTDPKELAERYGLDQLETLRACIALQPRQRACVRKQANPLLAGQPCRLPESLGLQPPRWLTEALAPKPAPLPPEAGRAMLAGLRGVWIHEDAQRGVLESVEIGAGGRTRIERFQGGLASGPEEVAVFEFRNATEVRQIGRATTQRQAFFRLDRSAILLSGNRLHAVVRPPSHTTFHLLLNPSRVLQVRVGSCEVIELSYLAVVKASCAWSQDEHHSVPALKIRYALGRWAFTHRYLRIRDHLIHEHLLARRFVRRGR